MKKTGVRQGEVRISPPWEDATNPHNRDNFIQILRGLLEQAMEQTRKCSATVMLPLEIDQVSNVYRTLCNMRSNFTKPRIYESFFTMCNYSI